MSIAAIVLAAFARGAGLVPGSATVIFSRGTPSSVATVRAVVALVTTTWRASASAAASKAFSSARRPGGRPVSRQSG